MSTLELGAAVVPVHAGLALTQSLTTFGGYSTLRLLSGSARKQTQWQKLRVEIAGTGWIPPALQGLDYTAALTLKCPFPRGVLGATVTIAVPSARRTDTGYTPLGFGFTAGAWVATTISITDHVATLGSVSGATQYRVLYWPQISVFADPPQEAIDGARGEWRWTLRAEEA
jgi:hypothetical protein